MIQGEIKQWYYDENHPDAIERQFIEKKKDKTKILSPLELIRQKQADRQEMRTFQQEQYKEQNPIKAKLKEYGAGLYNKQGVQVASNVGSKVVSILGGIKRFVVGSARQNVSQGRQMESQANKQRRQQIQFQRRMAIARQRNQIQQRSKQMQRRRPSSQQNQMYQQQRMLQQQAMMRQRQAQDLERKKTRTLTPGFYNKNAEIENPYNLRSRYKINFGQNIFSNLDPENQKVFNNGKYKWRAD